MIFDKIRCNHKLNELAHSTTKLLIALFGWMLVAPCVILTPKRKTTISVIGREDGKFVDNTKYFFIESNAIIPSNVKVTFITERLDVYRMLRDANYSVLHYPSLSSILYLIRCSAAIVDSEEWHLHFRRFFLVGSNVLQLWHGTGFKRICIDRWQHSSPSHDRLGQPTLSDRLGYIGRIFGGGFIQYDAINSTSAFYRDQVFRKAFRSRDYPILGYPRHTFGQLPGPAGRHALLNTDRPLLQRVRQWQAQSRRIVVVAPTFRETRSTPLGLTPEVITMLDAFCAQNGVEFIFKLHPFEQQHSNLPAQHLHSYNSHADIYPLLPLSSALVTDYSSIYMDYLLLDKPVLFLVPDLEQYAEQDRQLQFDYAAMTPGPKLQNWSEVTSCLLEQWEHDAFSTERQTLCRLAFEQEDPTQATARILTYMTSKRWIPDRPIPASEKQ